MSKAWQETVREAEACTLCAVDLPAGPRPVFRVHPDAKILIVGQAPGIRVHKTGIPFNDPSGERLRAWMGIDKDTFYTPEKVSILPMGFCYPGTGKSGDLPPRKECAHAWRDRLLSLMPDIALTLVIGQYAIDWHLKGQKKKNLTETVKAWREYYPAYLPLPHPSPRNNIWLKKNPWFEDDVLPELKNAVLKSL
ncbi:MAG: uracil-DNA glycosylase family protein [Alphaproteobacteria bacterium]